MKDPFRRCCECLLPLVVAAAGELLPAQAADGVETLSASIPEAKVSLAIEGLPHMEKAAIDNKQIVDAWNGKLADGTVVDVFFWLLGPDPVANQEPSGLILQFLAVRPKYVLKKQVLVGGAYGYAPCLALATAVEGDRATVVYGFGAFETGGYAVEIDWHGAMTDADREKLAQAVSRGIKYEGKPWDPKWSAAEMAERWRLATGDNQPPDKIIRTAHYVVMTDSRAGQTFAEKVEENYKAIFAHYPFEDHPCDRLMPVFVMRDKGGYQGLCVRLGVPEYVYLGTPGPPFGGMTPTPETAVPPGGGVVTITGTEDVECKFNGSVDCVFRCISPPPGLDVVVGSKTHFTKCEKCFLQLGSDEDNR